jgi:HK97 gp10 family phage protein
VSDPVRIEIVNLAEWQAKLKKLDDVLAEQAVVRALTAGALLIENDAKRRAPYKTGTLRRSIHTEQGDGMEVLIGPDAPYGARIEFGYVGPDKRGRMFHQPAQPYLRPAFDENRDAAIKEVGEALAQLLEAAL